MTVAIRLNLCGPGGGIESLEHSNGVPWQDVPGHVGNLAEPFPYADRWNAAPVDESATTAEQYAAQDRYWSTQHVNGAIPICDPGGPRQLLIVTGTERGNIWFDDRSDWGGLFPASTDDGQRVTFYDWVRRWADDRLREFRGEV